MDKLTKLEELQQYFNAECSKILREAQDQLEKERQQLDEDRKALESLFPKLEKVQVPSKIVLDVGGTKFATSMATLCSVKNTFFDTMFSGRWTLKPSEDGSYFIDRDPSSFQHVLNFLRDGVLEEVLLSEEDLIRLSADSEFYQIESLTQHLDSFASFKKIRSTHSESDANNNNNNDMEFENISKKMKFVSHRTDLQISQDGLVVSKIGKDKWNNFHQRVVEIGYVIPGNAVCMWKLKILMCNNWIAVGLRDGNRPIIEGNFFHGDYNYKGHGFYLLACNGKTWHSDLSSMNWKPFGFPFATGDIVEIRYDGAAKVVIFSKEGSQEKIQLSVPTLSALIPVILFHGDGDSVRIDA